MRANIVVSSSGHKVVLVDAEVMTLLTGLSTTGCPVAYVPFSLQMPERVRQLQAHQAQYASRQAWWLCDRTQPPSIAVVDHAIELEDEPRLMHPSSVSHMRDELQAALSSTFIPPRRYSSIPHGTTSMPVKTSESHPIK